jgi:hypothetical protein
MFIPALRCALSILFFRAGPADMPFDPGPTLTRRCVAFALLIYAGFCAVLLPALAAILASALTVLGLGLVTRAMLSLRKLENRFQQTFNALLLTNGLLTLPMIPLQMQIAPLLLKLHDDPQLAQHLENVQMPLMPMLLMSLLGFWQFAACSRVYGQATDSGAFSGALLTVICFFGMTLFVMFASPLITLLGG